MDLGGVGAGRQLDGNAGLTLPRAMGVARVPRWDACGGRRGSASCAIEAAVPREQVDEAAFAFLDCGICEHGSIVTD